MSDQIRIDDEYKRWIQQISSDFRKSQIKAASTVNSEMLKFYWRLGEGIEQEKQKYSWGSKLYEQISKDLKAALPGMHSFSPRNLRYMNHYYRLFSSPEISQQAVAVSEGTEILQQAVAQLSPIFCIPWGHIVNILDKCGDDPKKASFNYMV